MSYTYDSLGNLISATDPSGTTTMTYIDGSRLATVTYSDGLSLDYTYDAGGQRTQMVEMSGKQRVVYTVNYSYNTVGQLSKLTDGSGSLIISYSYNAVGEVSREDKGDGTYSTYTYDGMGDVLDLRELRGQRHGWTARSNTPTTRRGRPPAW